MPWWDRIAAGDSEVRRQPGAALARRVSILDRLEPEVLRAAGDSRHTRSSTASRCPPTSGAWQDEQTGGDTANLIDRLHEPGVPGEPPLPSERGARRQYGPESYLRILEFLGFYVARRSRPGGPLRQFANLGRPAHRRARDRPAARPHLAV